MHGNTLSRTVRLISHLCAAPSHLPFYLRHGPFSRRTPLQMGTPWFSLAAIEFLESWIRPGLEVFEFGSGGSTVFFAERHASVDSVEDHQAWFDSVNSEIKRRQLSNVRLHHHPYDFVAAADFASSAYLQQLPRLGRTFDAIVVDGTEYSTQVRVDCFFLAEQFVRPGGIIILDDAWRYQQPRVQHKAKHFRTFTGIGPCRPGVTATDIYFY